MINKPVYVCTYPLNMLNHFGVAAYSCCPKRFNIAHSADRVMPHDLAHILQQACATIHNSRNPDTQKTRQDRIAWRAATVS